MVREKDESDEATLRISAVTIRHELSRDFAARESVHDNATSGTPVFLRSTSEVRTDKGIL